MVRLKSLFVFIFGLSAGACLIPEHSNAQNLQCSQIFTSSETRLELTEDVIDRLDTPQHENGGLQYLRMMKRAHVAKNPVVGYLIGAIISHPRLSDTFTDTFFTKGGPLKVGYDSKEIKAVFKVILDQPAHTHAPALHRILVEMNAGGKELQDFYASMNWENKIVKVITAEGGLDAVRVVSYDPNFGEFVVESSRTRKIERILGATFYERIGSQQIQKLGFKYKALPESEWFKVIAKKDIGPSGSIYYATLKKDVRVKTPGSELTPEQRNRLKPAQLKREEEEIQEHMVRHYVNGVIYDGNIPVMTTITRFLPTFAKVFQIKTSLRDGNYIFQYPDVNLVNSILDSMPKDQVTPVRLLTTAEFEAVPLLAFAKAWADGGKLYMAEQGTAHFHDFSLHLLAYLSMPKELALANRSHVKFWLQVKNDKVLSRNKGLQDLANKEIDLWVNNFDHETGLFIQKLGLSQDHTGKIAVVEKVDHESLNYVVDLFVRRLAKSESGEGKEVLEKIYRQPRDGVRLTAQEIEIVRAIPLLSGPVTESQIPGLVEQTKRLLFWQ